MQQARAHHARSRTLGDLAGRGIGGFVAGLALVLGAMMVGAVPAEAHAELESSSPKDGATLAAAPAGVSFTFGEALLDKGNAITLTLAGTDELLTLATPTVDGPRMSVPWPQKAPAGTFTAAYRVVSEDGHPVAGSITFTVKQATGATPAGVGASPSAAALDPPTGLPSAVAAAAPSPPPAASGGAGPESQPEAGVLAWVLGIGVIALIGALAATWVTRRTRQ